LEKIMTAEQWSNGDGAPEDGWDRERLHSGRGPERAWPAGRADHNEGVGASQLPQCTEEILQRVEAYFAASSRRSNGEELLLALRTAYRKASIHTCDVVTRVIFDQLGRFVAAHGGIEGTLYVYRIKDEHACLIPQFSTATQRGELPAITVDGRTAEGRAIMLRAFQYGDCTVNPSHEDWQQLRIPICAVEVDEPPLGLLSLCSMEENFGGPRLRQAVIDAKEFAVPLLCLARMTEGSETACPWSPFGTDWSFAGFLTDVCRAAADVMSARDTSAHYSASIWNVDAARQTTWLTATHGYDYEFLTKELGSWESFTKAISARRVGECHVGVPGPEFVKLEKAQKAGLSTVLSVPIHISEPQQCAPFVFHLYRFAGWGNGELFQLPEEYHGTELSVMFEEWLINFERLRRDTAKAYLSARMETARKIRNIDADSDEAADDWDDLHHSQLTTLKTVLVECLQADGCSIFVPDRTGRKLVLVSTTGVVDDGHFWAENQHAVVVRDTRAKCAAKRRQWPLAKYYDLENEEDRGLMAFLYENPTAGPLRLHTLHEPPARVGRIVRRRMEHLSPNTRDRRFLGTAITGDDGRVRAVIRLVRPTTRAPFSRFDEELLVDLAALCRDKDFWYGRDDEVATGSSHHRSVDDPH
jgi:hypothetical protein